jgi:hypothetical protein
MSLTKQLGKLEKRKIVLEQKAPRTMADQSELLHLINEIKKTKESILRNKSVFH